MSENGWLEDGPGRRCELTLQLGPRRLAFTRTGLDSLVVLWTSLWCQLWATGEPAGWLTSPKIPQAYKGKIYPTGRGFGFNVWLDLGGVFVSVSVSVCVTMCDLISVHCLDWVGLFARFVHFVDGYYLVCSVICTMLDQINSYSCHHSSRDQTIVLFRCHTDVNKKVQLRNCIQTNNINIQRCTIRCLRCIHAWWGSKEAPTAPWVKACWLWQESSANHCRRRLDTIRTIGQSLVHHWCQIRNYVNHHSLSYLLIVLSMH